MPMAFGKVVVPMLHRRQLCYHHLYLLPLVVNGPSEKFLMCIFVLPWAVTNIWVGSWLFLIQAKRRSAFYHRTGKIKHTQLSSGVWSYVSVAFWKRTAQRVTTLLVSYRCCLPWWFIIQTGYYSVCANHTGHKFQSLPILNDEELLLELKGLLTLEANYHVPMATGVPPHVEHQQAIKDVHTVCIETRNTVTQFRTDIEKAISNAVDAKVAFRGRC